MTAPAEPPRSTHRVTALGFAARIRHSLHRHRDPDWQLVGCNRYEQCRCGARRVSRAYANIVSPVAIDWPPMRDQHNQASNTSGWQHGDWLTSGYPRDGIRRR